MSDVEESVEIEPVRKTRSGRAVKTPGKLPKAARPAPASRKGRKKAIVMETDEEEIQPTKEKKADCDEEDKLLETSDTEINTEENNKNEEDILLINSEDEDKVTKPTEQQDELVMNDLAMLEEIIHTNEKIEQEIVGNIVTEEVTEVMEEVTEVMEEVTEVMEATQEEKDELIAENEVDLLENKENEEMVGELSSVPEVNGVEVVPEVHDKEEDTNIKMVEENGHAQSEEKDDKEIIETKTDEEQQQQVPPEAENISDDELPAPPCVKVPETEEVSDEELPGPKRAELPADTEVVSEDELMPGPKRAELPADTEVVSEDELPPPPKKDEQVEVASQQQKDSGAKRKLSNSEDYDPTSPTSESEAPAQKKSKEDKEEKEKDSDGGKTKPKKLPELDKYWKAVNDDPTDFTGWTYLLQYVDQENDMEAAREAYDAFLSHYPYCYGYWRKYADYEKRKGNKKKCEEVFERGLKAIPLSVDLWIHYLTYAKATKGEDEEFLRAQFERALTACGLEFRSDRLWDSYIKWETEGKRLQKVTAIFDRLLATPTQGYTTHFDNFQEHVASHAPNKILDVDEFMALRKEVRNTLKSDEKAAAVSNVENAELPPGDEDSKLYTTEEETKCIRERIVSIRRKIHKNTVNAVTARWNFEEGIKRPYFHVKPLERCQLKNWHEYLDYEIAQAAGAAETESTKDRTRIIVLFERCLIACALYEEFWLKYVTYLEQLNDTSMQQRIRDVYERACTIHHLKKPNLHMQWAIFEELCSNVNRAAEILVNLEKQVPNVLQVAFRRINLERRRGDFEKCRQLFDYYIGNFKNKLVSSNISIKYSRFCLRVLKDFDKAQEVLKSAITKDPNNPRLYLQLVDLTLQKDNVQENDILTVLDEFLTKDSADPDQKVLFAQRKLEFLEDFGSSIEAVQSASDQYQKLQKIAKESSTSSKKKDGNKNSESITSTKKEKKDSASSTAQSAYGNYNYANASGNGAAGGQPPYNYSAGSQQGQYNYAQYGQGDQYQYQNWQYPQGGYGGYNQWGGYTGGYGY